MRTHIHFEMCTLVRASTALLLEWELVPRVLYTVTRRIVCAAVPTRTAERLALKRECPIEIADCASGYWFNPTTMKCEAFQRVASDGWVWAPRGKSCNDKCGESAHQCRTRDEGVVKDKHHVRLCEHSGRAEDLQ